MKSLMNDPQYNIYEFDDFRVNAARRLLVSRDGEAISLTPKVFDTLLYLVEHHGAVLDKDEMMRAIWPHTVIPTVRALFMCPRDHYDGFSLRRGK
jgi:DNA-binding winged helix-turn-helix (wHTH) protein